MKLTEKQKLFIGNVLPHVDLEKEYTKEQIRGLCQVATEKVRPDYKQKRMDAIKEKNLSVGSLVYDNQRGPYEISSISDTGYLRLRGRKGEFNPLSVQVKKSELS